MQAKGSLPPGNGGRCFRIQKNFKDIKANRHGESEHVEPVAGTAAQQVSLAAVDSARGGTVLRVNGAFHLCKHKRISLPADKINFTGVSGAKITAQYFHTVSPQPGGGHQLSIGSAITDRRRGFRIPRAAPSVQQV